MAPMLSRRIASRWGLPAETVVLPGRWHRALVYFFLIFLTGFIQQAWATQPSGLRLSEAERNWLQVHPVIRIGVDAKYAPYSFVSDDGTYHGVAPDLLALVSQQLGVKFEVVPGLSWPQIIDGAKTRTLDAIATAVRTPERDTFLNFTDIYIPTPLVIMSRKDDTRFQTPADLHGKKIALVKGYSSTKKVLSEHPAVVPELVDNSLDGLRAVASSHADAYVGVLGVSTFLASKHGIANLKVTGPYEMALNGQRLGVRKDWPELTMLLDKAIKAIPEAKKIAIMNKWVPVSLDTAKPTPLKLTNKEKQWLAQHSEVRLAIDPDFAPIEFVDDKGKYTGISAEYVKRISQLLGIKMHVVPDISWSEALQRAKHGKVDVFAAISPTDERREYLGFSKPYFKYPVVIYTRSDAQLLLGIESLADKKVAVVKDYFVHETLKQFYPSLDILAAGSTYDGLSAVSTGKADAFIGDIATATFVIRKFSLSNLKIATPTEISTPGHSFGVRKDWPILLGLINKALDTITVEEQHAFKKKWIEIEVEKFPHYWIWIALAALGMMMLFVITSTYLRIIVKKRTLELERKNKLLVQENRDRIRAEEALMESEYRLSQFFHATFEMVFFHDEGKILDVNPATVKTTEYSVEELVGRNLLEFVTEQTRQQVLMKMGAGDPGPYEARILTKSGVEMPVEVHAMDINIAGKVARVVSLRDITERKKFIHELQHAHDALEVKVEQRTEELSQANEKLKQLDQLKSMFIASVSHELRTPLNSIIGFSSMMMQGTFGTLEEKYQDYITRINKSGQHLLDLISDVIDISKLESGYVAIEPTDFDLAELVNEAVTTIRPQAEHKSLVLQVDMLESIMLHTDRRRVLQCLLNFLSNAVKYSKKGSISISVSDEQDDVLLSVTDTGIGIDEEDTARLYEAFERIDSRLRVKAGGTGLGLYLTKKIATEILQGSVGMSSVLGEGSTFWIRVRKDVRETKQAVMN